MSTIKVHQYDHTGYWTGASMEVSVMSGLQPGWTFAPFPGKMSKGKFAKFEGGQWNVTKTPRPQVPTIEEIEALEIAQRKERAREQNAAAGGDEPEVL